MKKKYFILIGLMILILSLASCFESTTRDPDVVENEPTIIQIENDITQTFDLVSKACVGIRVVTQNSKGSGSGVVYKKVDGYYYVITNQHVVNDAIKIQVFLGELVYYSAVLVGSDTKNDLAVIKFKVDIYGGKVGIIDITSNDDILKAGQTVLAIGCPLGLEQFNTLSVGIVSRINSSSKKVQHTAQINPGNSGGGLFNLSGRLVGINTEKVTSTDGSSGEYISVEGMGYALGMDLVRKVISDIEATNGSVDRPLLSITVALVNRYISDNEYVNLLPSTLEQAVIIQTVDNGSGKAAGLIVNDVIVEVQGIKISSLDDIANILNTSLYGDTISVKLFRYNSTTQNFEPITLNIELIKYE